MRILFVTANSPKAYLDIEREHRALLDVAREGKHSLTILPAAQIDDLREALKPEEGEESFDVLHFSGHATKREGLKLRGKGKGEADLDAADFRGFLEGSGVKLVVLNACESQPLAQAAATVVPAAIGTTKKVADWAARRFTTNFYAALNEHRTVHGAYEAAARQAKAGHPYMIDGSDTDFSLPLASAGSEAKIEGENAFYRVFYEAYLDEQIAEEEKNNKLNSMVFWSLFAIAAGLTWLVLYREDPAGSVLSSLMARISEMEFSDPLGSLRNLDVAAPEAVALFQRHLNPRMSKRKSALGDLKRLIAEWDHLEEDERELIRGVVHNSIKESLSNE